MKRDPIAVILPLDDRPVTYDYPIYLARAAGFQAQLPQREWLGNPWRPSQHTRLAAWLAKAAQTADVLIVAIDTLAYGGLIPSRTSSDPLPEVLERLAVLRQIKTARPGLSILASSVIQRVNRGNSSEEEKEYWATYGARMFRLSYLEHKTTLGLASAEETGEAQDLRKQIPAEVYDDYRQGRQRNHAVNQAMLDWSAEGVFDYLILPQDDTADFGWNIAEAQTLQARIRRQRLNERAITYPGADEIGSLLLASAICRRTGFHPKVWPRYSSVLSPGVITAYEDRPVQELLKAHLAPLGGSLANSSEEADLILFFNAPGHAQGEGFYQWLIWRGLDNLAKELKTEGAPAILEQLAGDRYFQNTRNEMESPHRSPEEFVRSLLAGLHAGSPSAVADVAYVNGADLILGSLLVQHPEIAELSAYGGWNTAGNTLGTVLAQAIIHLAAQFSEISRDQIRAHLEFLFMRFIDDFYYQARERTRLMIEDLPELGIQPGFERLPDEHLPEIERRLAEHLQVAAAELEQVFVRSGLVKRVQISNIYLPWKRLFEVGFDVQVDLPETLPKSAY
jgi:hypothetical protein